MNCKFIRKNLGKIQCAKCGFVMSTTLSTAKVKRFCPVSSRKEKNHRKKLLKIKAPSVKPCKCKKKRKRPQTIDEDSFILVDQGFGDTLARWLESWGLTKERWSALQAYKVIGGGMTARVVWIHPAERTCHCQLRQEWLNWLFPYPNPIIKKVKGFLAHCVNYAGHLVR